MISMINRLRDLRSRVQKAESQGEEVAESARPHPDTPPIVRPSRLSTEGTTHDGTMITTCVTTNTSPCDTMVIK